VLILGVYLADRPNTADHLMESFQATNHCRVDQRWIALNGKPLTDVARRYTVDVLNGYHPKFALINAVVRQSSLHAYDYLIISDDDIRVPRRFIDAFIGWQQHMDLSLAQPARTWNSYIDHRFVRRRIFLAARQTRFVEIGPLFSVHRSLFDHLLPFNEESPMGWGYDLVWPVLVAAAGKTMGIIDATPIDHSLRSRNNAYSYNRELENMAKYLAERAHLRQSEAFCILRQVSRWG
jgi:hypothetical protein